MGKRTLINISEEYWFTDATAKYLIAETLKDDALASPKPTAYCPPSWWFNGYYTTVTFSLPVRYINGPSTHLFKYSHQKLQTYKYKVQTQVPLRI